MSEKCTCESCSDEPAEFEDVVEVATEVLAEHIVFMSCEDHELMTEFYQDVCIALRDQIALKLAGHTDEAFN